MLQNVTRKWTRQELNVAVAASADNMDYRTVTVTQSGEYTFTIDTDVGNCGYAFIFNHDATNFVKIGFATGDYKMRALPGEPAVFRLDPAVSALYLLADTADCTCDIIVTEA